MHERCERHPKRHTKKKESESLSETDGLCSPERGIGFGGSPIGYAGFMSCFKVQGNFLLLCSSNNFVGYSYVNPLHAMCLICKMPHVSLLSKQQSKHHTFLPATTRHKTQACHHSANITSTAITQESIFKKKSLIPETNFPD